MMKVDGGCHCGAIAYVARVDPETVTICHCRDCQVLTGSAYRVTAMARAEDVVIGHGAPKRYVRRSQAGKPRHQLFCGDCGTPLFTTGEGSDAAVWGIRVGTIRQRDALAPQRRIWCASALAWSGDITGVPGAKTD